GRPLAARQAGDRRRGGDRLRRRGHLRHRLAAQGGLGPAHPRGRGARRPRLACARRARVPLRPGLTMKMITALIRPERLEAVEEALAAVLDEGDNYRITVDTVEGRGRQAGEVEYVRGRAVKVR